jgi:hypothetical protein
MLKSVPNGWSRTGGAILLPTSQGLGAAAQSPGRGVEGIPSSCQLVLVLLKGNPAGGWPSHFILPGI